MATGMKVWIGLVLAGVAFITIGQLPPTSYTALPPDEIPPAEARARAISDEIRRAEGVLKRFHWNDIALERLFTEAEDGLAFAGGGSMTQEAMDAYRDHIAEELESLPVRDREAKVGVFWMDINEGSYHTTTTLRYSAIAEYYIGERDGTPYCFVLYPAHPAYMEDRRIRIRSVAAGWIYGSGVAGCRLVAQFGHPGEKVLEWLEVGAMSFGTGLRHPDRDYYRWRFIRGPLGRSNWSRANQRIELDRCMSGQAEGCLELVLTPINESIRPKAERSIEQQSPLTTMYARSSLGSTGSYLFQDLIEEFGPEAFDRFWSSDLGVEESFEAAFGLPMGDWLVSWMQDNLGSFLSGPRLTQSARFGGLLTVMLLGLGSGLWYRRRKVA